MPATVTPGDLGAEFAIGTVVANKITVVQATSATAGKVALTVAANYPSASNATAATPAYVTAAVTAGVNSKQDKVAYSDEGGQIAAAGVATAVNFTGAGVTATHAGGVVTVDIPGGATPLVWRAELQANVNIATNTEVAMPLTEVAAQSFAAIAGTVITLQPGTYLISAGLFEWITPGGAGLIVRNIYLRRSGGYFLAAQSGEFVTAGAMTQTGCSASLSKLMVVPAGQTLAFELRSYVQGDATTLVPNNSLTYAEVAKLA